MSKDLSNQSRDLSRQGTGESVLDAIQDPDSAVFDAGRARIKRCGFRGYLFACVLVTTTLSLAAVLLWSDVGCGQRCLDVLKKQARLQPIFGGIVALVMLSLYLLDFFLPPHLPGHFCTLSENGSLLSRCFLGVALLSFLAVCYLMAGIQPTFPLVVTIFLCPVGVVLLRQATMPKERFSRGLPRAQAAGGGGSTPATASSLKRKGFEMRMEMLKLLTGEERDQKDFYVAAMWAFVFAAFLSLVIWTPWAALDYDHFEEKMAKARTREDRELVFIRWASPLIVTFANFVFASFMGLRVALNHAYTATDQVRNRLIIGGTRSCMNEEMMNHRINMLKERLQKGEQSPVDLVKETQDKMQQYLVQHISHMRQLSNIVKSVGCAFVVFLGALYVAFQLTAADSHLAFMVQGFLGAFLITFMLIVCVSFGRLWQVMRHWLTDLPLWKSAAGICKKDWAIAFVICLAFPILPLALILSVVNQQVRRWRGLCKDSESEKHCLTERMSELVRGAKQLNWAHVVKWCYVVASVMMVYKMTPLLLNVVLAWMTEMMEGLSFVWICAATFTAGMVLFMLPPIPGPPIYLFGGIVIADSCPWGFWWGCFTCIALCFVLKLTACAVQQKVFGEMLGNMQSVRQTVGVHKPFIRAIEMVLRRPGMSFGKSMILCGGPDWPTSVLAGILRVSVSQCLLGTLPIILNVVPLTLTGSFYLKRERSQIWVRAGNLMFALTALVSVMFWVGMGWAIQEVFDREHDNLVRPKEEFVELDWLDHRAAYLAEKCVVVWADLPAWVKIPYGLGAVLLVAVGVLFFWRSALCFRTFQVTDDISALRWVGANGLIKLPGLIGLIVAASSYLGLVVFYCWYNRRSRTVRTVAAAEIDAKEEEWKAQRLELARTASTAASTPKGFGGTSLPKSLFEAEDLGDDVATSAATIANSMELGEMSSPTKPSGWDLYCCGYTCAPERGAKRGEATEGPSENAAIRPPSTGTVGEDIGRVGSLPPIQEAASKSSSKRSADSGSPGRSQPVAAGPDSGEAISNL